jgi:hypothetical protein
MNRTVYLTLINSIAVATALLAVFLVLKIRSLNHLRYNAATAFVETSCFRDNFSILTCLKIDSTAELLNQKIEIAKQHLLRENPKQHLIERLNAVTVLNAVKLFPFFIEHITKKNTTVSMGLFIKTHNILYLKFYFEIHQSSVILTDIEGVEAFIKKIAHTHFLK